MRPVHQAADVTHGQRGGDQRKDGFAGGGTDGQIDVIEVILVGDIERDAPTPLGAGGTVIAEGHGVEIEHFDILRNAPFGGKMHFDMVDKKPEEVIIGIDRTDRSVGYFLHGVGEKEVIARLDQGVNLGGKTFGTVGATFGTRHAVGRFFVNGGMLDDLRRRLLYGNNRNLRDTIDGGCAGGILGNLCHGHTDEQQGNDQ